MRSRATRAIQRKRRGGAGGRWALAGGAPRPRLAPGDEGARPPREARRPHDAEIATDEVLATLFHELRGPLATARNWISILRNAELRGEQAQHGLEVIDRQIALLARRVEDLLDVSRVRRGKIRLEKTRLDLAELARGTLEDHGLVFARRGLELRAEIPGEAIWVHGDGARLTQVLGNLLQNAAKFTPRGERVCLALETDELSRMARLRLRDTGPGFDPSAADALFRPYEQAEATAARRDGGLGLGLALVRGLVELHGGTVEARSDGPGTGAEFVVRLPLAGACPTPNQPCAAGASHVPS